MGHPGQDAKYTRGKNTKGLQWGGGGKDNMRGGGVAG